MHLHGCDQEHSRDRGDMIRYWGACARVRGPGSLGRESRKLGYQENYQNVSLDEIPKDERQGQGHQIFWGQFCQQIFRCIPYHGISELSAGPGVVPHHWAMVEGTPVRRPKRCRAICR